MLKTSGIKRRFNYLASQIDRANEALFEKYEQMWSRGQSIDFEYSYSGSEPLFTFYGLIQVLREQHRQPSDDDLLFRRFVSACK